MRTQNRQDAANEENNLSGATFLVLATVILGVALQVSNGFYDEIALLLIVVSFLFCTLGTLRPSWVEGAISSPQILDWIIYVALFGQFALLLKTETTQNAPLQVSDSYWVFQFGIICAALLTLWPTTSTRFLEKWRLPLLLLVFAVIGAWSIIQLKTLVGDVWMVQQNSAYALLGAKNPYAITFPDIYNRDMTFYKPEHIANGRLLFGYVYPPLSLLFVLPGLLLSDVRFALLLFWTLAGALIGYTRPSRYSILFVALLLFTPRIFFASMVGWTEPMLCAMLALTAFFALRKHTKAGAIALGALLALKQYTFFLLPLSFLIVPSKIEYSKLLRRALATVTLVSLPMILWNPAAFFHSAIRLNFTLPFRLDGLNVIVWLAKNTGFVVPTLVGFTLAAGAVVIALRRCERTPFGFASATAWVYFVFFLFGRQGFANYYLFVMCAMCCALSTLELD